MDIGERKLNVTWISEEKSMDDVTCSIYCPTWQYSYSGWRGFLAGIYLFIPKIEVHMKVVYPLRKYIRRDRERVFYNMGGRIICSPENYAFLLKERGLK